MERGISPETRSWWPQAGEVYGGHYEEGRGAETEPREGGKGQPPPSSLTAFARLSESFAKPPEDLSNRQAVCNCSNQRGRYYRAWLTSGAPPNNACCATQEKDEAQNRQKRTSHWIAEVKPAIDKCQQPWSPAANCAGSNLSFGLGY